LLSTSNDPLAVAMNILKVKNDPDLRKRLITNGYSTASDNSNDIKLAKYLKFISDMLLKK
jgi:hypothetical protein